MTWRSKARTIPPQQQDRNPIQINEDGVSASSMSTTQMKDKGIPLRTAIHDFEQIYLENDNRSPMDKEVDIIQNFNDTIISSNGFHIIPFRTKEKDLSSVLYAGSMMTELDKDLFMYICRPCDRAGFEQIDFLIHHTTTKHQNNTRTWIHQHYILPINKKEDETKKSHKDKFKHHQANKDKDHTRIQNLSTRNTEDAVQVPDPFKQFNKAMFDKVMGSVRDQSFPEKHRVDIACLITEFYTTSRHYEIEFLRGFTMNCNAFGQKHWIISAFETLQQHQDTRQYLKDYSKEPYFEFFPKSYEQKLEVECIADLARKLFRMLIICEFVPTSYLSILAIIMCLQPKLNYPKSNTKLVSTHYIDLLLKIGAVRMIDRDNHKEERNSYTKRYTLTKDQIDPSIRKRKSNIHTPSPIHEDKRGGMDDGYNGMGAKQNTYTKQNIHISRDVDEGNIPNFCQTPMGDLNRSMMGYPLCNYCGRASHKRQFCSIKATDRMNGLKRSMHPDKEFNIHSAQTMETPYLNLPSVYPL